MQFLTLATGIIIMAMLGMFNVHRHGQINSAGVILYAFTSCKYNMTSTSVCLEFNATFNFMFDHSYHSC